MAESKNRSASSRKEELELRNLRHYIPIEYLKAISTLVLLSTVIFGFCKWSSDRQVDQARLVEEQFHRATIELNSDNPVQRIGAVALLAKYAGQDYKNYHGRLKTHLVEILRFETDFRVQKALADTLAVFGAGVIDPLLEVHRLLQWEIQSVKKVNEDRETLGNLESALRGSKIALVKALKASKEVRELDLSKVDFSGGLYWGVNEPTPLEFQFWKADLSGVTFLNVDLRLAMLDGAIFKAAHFKDTDLSGLLSHINFEGADFNGGSLDHSLDRTRFKGATLFDVRFGDGVSLVEANFEGATVKKVRLVGAILMRACLKGATLIDVNLKGADLLEASLAEAELSEKVDLEGASLRSADLQGADLTGIVNWNKIRDIDQANVYGVKNAPDGFLDWAKKNGAIEAASREGKACIEQDSEGNKEG